MSYKTFLFFKITLVTSIFLLLIGLSFLICETDFMKGLYIYEDMMNFSLKVLFLGCITSLYSEYTELKRKFEN